MIQFEVDMSEVDHLIARFPEVEEIANDETQKAMDEAGLMMTGMVSARTPVNFGTLRASIQFPRGWELRGSPTGGMTGTVKAAEGASLAGTSPHLYANYVEFGTRPHLPPREPIELWVIRKFGLTGDEAQDVTDRVRWGIAHHGTSRNAERLYGGKGYEMFRRAWNDGGGERARRIFEAIPVKVIDRWVRGV